MHRQSKQKVIARLTGRLAVGPPLLSDSLITVGGITKRYQIMPQRRCVELRRRKRSVKVISVMSIKVMSVVRMVTPGA